MEAQLGRGPALARRLLADRGVMDIAAEELTVPPGMDELFSLLQIKRHHESGEFDVVIVDCAPTGETLRLLVLPRRRPLVAGEGLSVGAAAGRRGAAVRADFLDVDAARRGRVRRRPAPGRAT